MSKAEQFLEGWMRHRSVLLELLDRIGDEHVNFKPWEDGSSLGGLAVHVAWTAQMFVDAVNNGQLSPPTSRPEFETMADVRRVVHDYTERTRSEILSLTDEHRDRIVDATQTLKFSAPGKVFLGTMRDHEIHHKGQLFVYARMVGVAPPFFVQR